MDSNYIAKVSIFKYGKIVFLSILFFWLIFPIFILVFICLKVRNEKFVFDGLKYEIHEGIFSKKIVERQITDIYTVNVEKTLFGKIFNYGNVFCKTNQNMGNSFNYIHMPEKLKEYLENQNNKAKLDIL